MTKRYAVFVFDHYYPSGGWEDFVGAYSDIKEARDKAVSFKKDRPGTWQIVDLQTLEVVEEG